MSRSAASSSRPAQAPAPTPIASSTRDLLVELAGQVFAEEGYASASVRELGRRAGVTSGAIYGNFRGKADLLAEAVDAQLTADLFSLPDDVASKSLIDVIAYQYEHYESRTQLTSLLLEGALAARGDEEVRQRLHETIERRIVPSVEAFEARRTVEGFGADVDFDAVVKLLWSIEIGLRVLSVLGFANPSEEVCADLVRRFVRGLQAPAAAGGRSGARTSAKKPAKQAAEKSARKAVPESKPGRKATVKPAGRAKRSA